MAFGRKKRSSRGRDPFVHLAGERQAAEEGTWFLEPDDGPQLDVETGISSNLSPDDLDDAQGERPVAPSGDWPYRSLANH